MSCTIFEVFTIINNTNIKVFDFTRKEGKGRQKWENQEVPSEVYVFLISVIVVL